LIHDSLLEVTGYTSVGEQERIQLGNWNGITLE
jgi:hypothetical protein